jgi:hypothetical protein
MGVAVPGDGVTEDIVVSCTHAEIGDDESPVQNVGADEAVGEPLKPGGGRHVSRSAGHILTSDPKPKKSTYKVLFINDFNDL